MRRARERRSAASITSSVFFFNDTATTEIYTLSLHDALPIYFGAVFAALKLVERGRPVGRDLEGDRKSTRLNSSHMSISYAVFCLKKNRRCYARRGTGLWTRASRASRRAAFPR